MDGMTTLTPTISVPRYEMHNRCNCFPGQGSLADGQLQGGTARWWAVGIFINAEEIVVFMFDFLLFIRN